MGSRTKGQPKSKSRRLQVLKWFGKKLKKINQAQNSNYAIVFIEMKYLTPV